MFIVRAVQVHHDARSGHVTWTYELRLHSLDWGGGVEGGYKGVCWGGGGGRKGEEKKREIAACMQKERFLNKLLWEERCGVAPFSGDGGDNCETTYPRESKCQLLAANSGVWHTQGPMFCFKFQAIFQSFAVGG